MGVSVFIPFLITFYSMINYSIYNHKHKRIIEYNQSLRCLLYNQPDYVYPYTYIN